MIEKEMTNPRQCPGCKTWCSPHTSYCKCAGLGNGNIITLPSAVSAMVACPDCWYIWNDVHFCTWKQPSLVDDPLVSIDYISSP